MRVEDFSYNKYTYPKYNAARKNNIACKSLLYNPNNFLHKINPVTKYMDDCMQLSITASRRFWQPVSKELAPYLTELNIDKDTKNTKLWDINKDNRQKYIIVMHGLSHNISSLQGLYEKVINKTDFAVLAPEYHGLNFGDTEVMHIEPKRILKGMNSAIKYLSDKGINEKDIFVCGHSFGGYAAAELAEHHPDLGRLILISSINTDMHWINAFQNGHPAGVPQIVTDTINKYKFSVLPLGWVFNTAKHLKKVKVPVDIIHAQNDKRVNVNTAKYLSTQCKNLNSLNILETGSHRMDNEKIETIISLLNLYA